MLKRMMWLVGLLGLLGSIGLTVPAQAATWHHGTPKVLRGVYQSTTPIGKHSAAGFAPIVSIKAKTFSLGISNYPEQLVKHLKYRRVHGRYQFKGTMKHIGFVKGGKVTFGLKKKGHNLYFVKNHGNNLMMPDRFKQMKHARG